MPKAATSAASNRGTNHFTSARVAVFNRCAAWKEGSRICEQFFGFLSKKTSAVESSSHAPSRARGRPSRGAAYFLSPAASVGQNRKWQIVKTRPGSRYVSGRVRLAEIYGQHRHDQNSRRPRFCYVEDERGWLKREGAKSLPMASCATCTAANIRTSRGPRILSIVQMGAGNFWERGMIFARRAITGPLRWRATD
jgi:hypothetical protein